MCRSKVSSTASGGWEVAVICMAGGSCRAGYPMHGHEHQRRRTARDSHSPAAAPSTRGSEGPVAAAKGQQRAAVILTHHLGPVQAI